MKNNTIIAILFGAAVGITVVVSFFRTSYGHGQGAILGAETVPSPEAKAYYSKMLPQLVDYAETLGLRPATPEEIEEMQETLSVAIPSDPILRDGNGIVLTERGERLAFSFWPSMDMSIDTDLQYNGFGIFSHYFEECWSWQKGRLESPTQERIAKLNDWVAGYTKKNPPSFDIRSSSGKWLIRAEQGIRDSG